MVVSRGMEPRLGGNQAVIAEIVSAMSDPASCSSLQLHWTRRAASPQLKRSSCERADPSSKSVQTNIRSKESLSL